MLVERPFNLGDPSQAGTWSQRPQRPDGLMTSLTAPFAGLAQYVRLLKQYAPMPLTAQLAALQMRRLAAEATAAAATAAANGATATPAATADRARAEAELAQITAAEAETHAAGVAAGARARAFLADFTAILAPALERLLAVRTAQLMRYRDLVTQRMHGAELLDTEPFAAALRQLHEEAAALAAAYSFIAPEKITENNANPLRFSPVAAYMTHITPYITNLAPALRSAVPVALTPDGAAAAAAAAAETAAAEATAAKKGTGSGNKRGNNSANAVNASASFAVESVDVLPFTPAATAVYTWADDSNADAEAAVIAVPARRDLLAGVNPPQPLAGVTVAEVAVLASPPQALTREHLDIWSRANATPRALPIALPDPAAIAAQRPVPVPASAPVHAPGIPSDSHSGSARATVTALPYTALSAGPSAAALLRLAEASLPVPLAGPTDDALSRSRVLNEVADGTGALNFRRGALLQPSPRTLVSAAAAALRQRDEKALYTALYALFAFRPALERELQHFADTGAWSQSSPANNNNNYSNISGNAADSNGMMTVVSAGAQQQQAPLVFRRANNFHHRVESSDSNGNGNSENSDAESSAANGANNGKPVAPLSAIPASHRLDPFLLDDLELTRMHASGRQSFLGAVQSMYSFIAQNALLQTPWEIPNEGSPVEARQARLLLRLKTLQSLRAAPAGPGAAAAAVGAAAASVVTGGTAGAGSGGAPKPALPIPGLKVGLCWAGSIPSRCRSRSHSRNPPLSLAPPLLLLPPVGRARVCAPRAAVCADRSSAAAPALPRRPARCRPPAPVARAPARARAAACATCAIRCLRPSGRRG